MINGNDYYKKCYVFELESVVHVYHLLCEFQKQLKCTWLLIARIRDKNNSQKSRELTEFV